MFGTQHQKRRGSPWPWTWEECRVCLANVAKGCHGGHLPPRPLLTSQYSLKLFISHLACIVNATSPLLPFPSFSYYSMKQSFHGQSRYTIYCTLPAMLLKQHIPCCTFVSIPCKALSQCTSSTLLDVFVQNRIPLFLDAA